MEKELLKFIDDEIKMLQVEYDKIDLSNVKKLILENENKKERILRRDFKFDYNLSIEESVKIIKEFFDLDTDVSDDDIKRLCFIIDGLNLFGNMSEEDSSFFESIISIAVKKIDDHISLLSSQFNEYSKRLNFIEIRIGVLKKMNDKISDSIPFSEDEIDIIAELFKSRINDLDSDNGNKLLELYVSFMKKLLENSNFGHKFSGEINDEQDMEKQREEHRRNSSDDDEELNDENEKVIDSKDNDLNEIKSILNSYYLNFDDFSSKSKELFINYADLDNMRSILEIIKTRIGFDYSKIMDLSHKFAIILSFSSPEIFSEIVNNIENDTSFGSLSDAFYDIYLKNTSFFIHGNIRCSKKDTLSDEGHMGDNQESFIGSFDSYCKNRELLMNYGIVDVNKCIDKCGTFFSLNYRLVFDRLRNLEELGFSKDLIFKNLSIFVNPCLFKSLDLLIEFGCLDYAKEYTSILAFSPKSDFFYRLAFARKEGISVFTSNGRLNPLIRVGSRDVNSPFYIGTKMDEQSAIRQRMVDHIDGDVSSVSIESSDLDKIVNSNTKSIIYFDESLLKKFSPFIDYYNKFDRFLYNGKSIRISEYEYNIDGVCISRKKVLRNISLIIRNGYDLDKNVLLYCICKDSILTVDEIKRIEKFVLFFDDTFMKDNKNGIVKERG